MDFNIITTEKFERQTKKLYKKYISIITDIEEIAAQVLEDYKSGISLGNNVYKIRLAIKSKGKGKSGGGRIIYYVVQANNEIYFLAIYDKSAIDSLSDNEIKLLIENI